MINAIRQLESLLLFEMIVSKYLNPSSKELKSLEKIFIIVYDPQKVPFSKNRTKYIENRIDSRHLRFGAKFPAIYDDWLICMISSNLKQYTKNFDEIIDQSSKDFIQSGLKTDSVIRVSRLAVVEGKLQKGAIGQISQKRLMAIRHNLASWLMNSTSA
jgi:mRNA interferase MazF